MAAARTMFEKIWQRHVVVDRAQRRTSGSRSRGAGNRSPRLVAAGRTRKPASTGHHRVGAAAVRCVLIQPAQVNEAGL